MIFSDRKFFYDLGMVLYLPLYRLDGDTITSKDKHGYTGTVTGALWTSQGRSFDGSDDQILIDDSAVNYLNLTANFTYECWVKPTDGGDIYGRFMSKTSASPYSSRVTLLGKELDDETNVRWETGSQVLNSGTGKMTVGAWNHVVGTHATAVKKIYVNGVEVATVNNPASSVSTAGGVLWIGSLFTDNQNFLGTIGEVRVYSRALTSAEVSRAYEMTKWRYQ